MLLAIPMALIWVFELNLFRLNLASKRSSVPWPALPFPKIPFFLSSLSARLIVFCSIPSSIPVNSAISDCLSKTCTLSTAFAGRFFVATFGSLPKNSLPSTKTLFTCSPCALIDPSLSTSIPGIFFRRSSTAAFGLVLNADALYSMVSLLIITGTW